MLAIGSENPFLVDRGSPIAAVSRQPRGGTTLPRLLSSLPACSTQDGAVSILLTTGGGALDVALPSFSSDPTIARHRFRCRPGIPSESVGLRSGLVATTRAAFTADDHRARRGHSGAPAVSWLDRSRVRSIDSPRRSRFIARVCRAKVTHRATSRLRPQRHFERATGKAVRSPSPRDRPACTLAIKSVVSNAALVLRGTRRWAGRGRLGFKQRGPRLRRKPRARGRFSSLGQPWQAKGLKFCSAA